MFQWIVMSATCTLLRGSLCSFRHVSHVCGYAKESRSSPVALSSFSTYLRMWFNLLHVSMYQLEPRLGVVRKCHSFYCKVGEFNRLVVVCEPAFVRRVCFMLCASDGRCKVVRRFVAPCGRFCEFCVEIPFCGVPWCPGWNAVS
eukprot:2603466-Pleurochrysis_carterae.AAC.1